MFSWYYNVNLAENPVLIFSYADILFFEDFVDIFEQKKTSQKQRKMWITL